MDAAFFGSALSNADPVKILMYFGQAIYWITGIGSFMIDELDKRPEDRSCFGLCFQVRHMLIQAQNGMYDIIFKDRFHQVLLSSQINTFVLFFQ